MGREQHFDKERSKKNLPGTDLSGSCLSAGNDPFRKEYESDEFYRIDLYSPDVDEFPAPYTGMADTA